MAKLSPIVKQATLVVVDRAEGVEAALERSLAAVLGE